MRNNLVFIAVIILLMAPGCNKNQNLPENKTDETDLINHAHSYFTKEVEHLQPIANASPRITASKTANWNQAKVIDLQRGKGVLVPITYQQDLFIKTTQGGQNNFHLSNLTSLLVYESKGTLHAEIVTDFPDTNYISRPQKEFTGMIYVEDWSGNSLAKYLYDSAGIRKYTPIPPSKVRSLDAVSLELCYEITGFNYATGSPSEGFAWSEGPDCIPSMVPIDDPYVEYPGPMGYGSIPSETGGSSGSNSDGSGQADITINPGKNIIADIADYFKCFTFSSAVDHSYNVSICVNQPNPGTREPWAYSPFGIAGSSWIGSNPINVGHTFLVLTETYGASTVTRNIGFYPASTVYPINGYNTAQGQLVDDEDHEFNLMGTFKLNSDQFQSIIAYCTLGNTQGFNYDLNSNNCTSFALGALRAGDYYLPSTIGNWFGGGRGNNPGDLGQDLRTKTIGGMTLSTHPIAHPNIGNCQ